LRLRDVGAECWRDLWLRGGLPRAYTATTDPESTLWREQYVAAFLERDIPQLGISIPSATLRRFWTMLCHYHGQLLNQAELARAFGISDMTVRRYLDILEGTFMLRLLQPWHVNIGKRLVKRPKLYIRDPGLLHVLLAIHSVRDLAAHNKLGVSWEGFALEEHCQSHRQTPRRTGLLGNPQRRRSGPVLAGAWQELGRRAQVRRRSTFLAVHGQRPERPGVGSPLGPLSGRPRLSPCPGRQHPATH
jgi:hypothetical protein